jgi:centromere protein I
MISFLTDPLLQKYVELKPSHVTSARIDLWLSASLEDVYEAERLGSSDLKYAKEILEGLCRHVESTKELHPTTTNFLRAYLPLWNGQDNVDLMLSLVAHIPTGPFENAYAEYFSPIERALASQGPSAYINIIDFYTSLLKHWIRAATTQPARRSSSHDKVFEDLATHVSTLSNSLLLSLPAGEGEALISCVLSFYQSSSRRCI